MGRTVRTTGSRLASPAGLRLDGRSMSASTTIRLQKVLAEAGVASRRGAEAVIRAGRVTVNGRVVTELGTRVDSGADELRVDGRAIRARRKVYLALNKPGDVVCTRKDERDRRTVLGLLPPEWAKTLYPVGRLDKETEGLLLLTNDGEFCLRVTHPRYGVIKQYVATVQGRATPDLARRLTRGVVDRGEELRARHAQLLAANQSRSVLALELTEGRNREVRRMFHGLGFRVEHLRRVRIGPVCLGELPLGRWRALTAAEVKTLLREPGQPTPNEH